MGTNFNARDDIFTVSRPGESLSVYVKDPVNLPDPVSGEIPLVLDYSYEIDNPITLSDAFLVNDNLIRGDGSSNVAIWYTGSGGLIKSVDGEQITLSSLVVDGSGATGPVFDVDVSNPTFPPPKGSVRALRSCGFRSFDSLGEIKEASRVILDTVTITGVSTATGGLKITNSQQIVINDSFFDPRTQPTPPDTWITIDVTSFTPPLTVIDVVISRNRFVLTSDSRSAIYISPLVFDNVNIQIAENGLINPGGNTGPMFQAGDEGEITAYADNLDGTITCSTADTGALANGDVINILRTENYNGGHTVSDVVNDTSFDITATFVDNPGRGTWHSGSIDQRDPRVTARDNTGEANGHEIAVGGMGSNASATTINTQDVWEDVVCSNFADLPSVIERFALCGDGTVCEFLYYGKEKLTGFANMQMKVIADSGGASEDDFEFGIGLNGADPVHLTFKPILPALNAQDAKSFIFSEILQLTEGDTVKLMVRCTTGTRDVLVEELAFFATSIGVF